MGISGTHPKIPQFRILGCVPEIPFNCYSTIVNFAEYAKRNVLSYTVNAAFNRATLDFSDGSSLQFEHTSRSNRWARASADATLADEVCRAIRQFRLNAKHLQLFFDDGTDVEFFAAPTH
jgi:hypothetical protein